MLHRLVTAITTAFVAALALPSGVAAQSCADEAGLRSMAPGAPIQQSFRNLSSERKRLYWMDPDGRRKLYGVIEPGTAQEQASPPGHYWVLTDDAESCVQVVVAPDQPSAIDIGGQAAAAGIAPPPPGVQVPLASPVPAGVPVVVEAAPADQGPQASPETAGPEVSPIEAYQLQGYFRLATRSDEDKVFNNLASGRPEVVSVRPSWARAPGLRAGSRPPVS